MRRLRCLALMALAVTALGSGCAALPGGGPPPLDTYQLSAPDVASAGPRLRKQILIADPSALKAFDSQNIVVSPNPGEVQYLKGVQWADRLPEIVQARLAETFEKSGAFTGVGKPGEGLAIDDQIVTEIRTFSIEGTGAQRAHVLIHVRIVNDRNGVVRAARSFEASVPVGGGETTYIAALDRAFGKVAADIVAWVRGAA